MAIETPVTCTDDAWMEKCYIAISLYGGTEMNFQAITDSVNIEPGEKDIESIPLVSGNRITKYVPEKETTITFEAYPVQIGTESSGTTGKGFVDLLHPTTAATPLVIPNNLTRTKARILVLWTNKPSVTTASEVGSATTYCYAGVRFGMCEAYISSVKTDFTDKIQKWTIIAKCAAFDKSADANIMWESAAASSITDYLPAIAAYATTNKFG